MYSTTAFLARRGLEMAYTGDVAFANKDEDEAVRVSSLFMLVISLTFIAMFGILFAVSTVHQYP